ncbi:MAG: hypothetical protein K9H16_13635 [Bacteroidales bacterium]|nr:hypothetical protein [Bacteroidales bacterium]
MIRNTLLLTLLFISTLFFTACETDVDINAEWKEITIVYGLLNQSEQDHYFRINKAFLGGNALEVAKIADSSSYNGGLMVVLQGSQNGEIVQTITFDTITIAEKDSGMFYNPYMLVYKGTGTLNQEHLYTLKVTNPASGKEIFASTRLIEEFTISKPPEGGKATFLRDFTTELTWRNAINAKRYEPVLRFHYFEVATGATDTIPKYIDWALPSQFADDISGEGSQEIEISNNGFYDFIQNNVKPATFAGRRLCGTIDFIVTAGGEEYDTYLRVNGPSYSLVQDRPEYTNVENGFGLMSSRYTVSKNRRLHPFAEDEILLLGLGFIPNPNL